MVAGSARGVGSLPITDGVLATAWDTALRLAWEGLRAKTTPVGAVIVDDAGAIIAAGRGRRYEGTAPDGQLAGTHIAHAEVNALAQLSSERDWVRTLMLTTLEPCAMCHGAAIQSKVAGFYFAGRDPYGGTSGLRFDTPQTRRRELVIGGPLPGRQGALAEMLHIAFLIGRGTATHVVDAQAAALPWLTGYTRQVRSLLQDALRRDDYQGAVDIAAAAPRDDISS
jgi:tRNA(Arg) A34 adenosine deaminase TadA